MKKYKKIIIIALCFALLLSMFTFSTFAADEPADQTAADAVAALSGTVWYVDSGWSCTANLAAYSLDYRIACSSVAGLCTFIRLGSVADSEGEIGYLADSIVFNLSSSEYLTLNSSDDFVITFGEISTTADLTALYEFLSAYGELLLSSTYVSDFYYQTYTIPAGWTVPAGYSKFIVDSFAFFNGEPSFYSLGFDGDILSSVDSINTISLISIAGDSLGSTIILSSDDSFTVSFDFSALPDFDVGDAYSVLGAASNLVYFIKQNGEVVFPPSESESLTNDLFSVFGSVGSWISGAVSSLVPMFWTGTELTFVGMLSVSSLALSVVFLVLYFIERFLRFGGG